MGRFGVGVMWISAAAAVLSACSDGGGSSAAASPSTIAPSPPAPPPPTVSTGPDWTAGVFEASGAFEASCEAPRSGVDIEGNGFPDQPGSTVEENFWLRSWTHETYLWNDEVVDRDPRTFDDRLEYFAVLRTTERTASGWEKDQFHFSQPTEEFLRQRNSEPRAGYGASLAAFSTTPPRDYRIRYTEPGSPAAETLMGEPALRRGTRVLEVDGVDLVNGDSQAEIDALNAGLFPESAGETHVFVVQDPGASETRRVTLRSADVAPKPVNRTAMIDTPDGPVGYILFNTFSPFAAEQEIAEAMAEMETAGVSDLVLDLRYNGGGLLAVASQLGYMIAGPDRTEGRTFELLQFNADAGSTNPVTGEFNEPFPFYQTGLGFTLVNGATLATLDLDRVFILSTDDTCSASESVINSLRGVDVEVVLIGGRTCGKPFGFYPTDNCGETYYTIQFQGVNDKGFGDYADGFAPAEAGASAAVSAPGCVAPDDFSRELGDPEERMLAAALTYQTTGACPAAPSATASALEDAVDGTPDVFVSGLTPEEAFLRDSRDLRMPY